MYLSSDFHLVRTLKVLTKSSKFRFSACPVHAAELTIKLTLTLTLTLTKERFSSPNTEVPSARSDSGGFYPVHT